MTHDPLEARFPVEIGGEYRGIALGGRGELELRATSVALHAVAEGESPPPLAPYEITLGRLRGVRWADGAMALRLDEGTIVLRGEPRLAAAARDLLARACDPGELTLALRAFGSHRAGADAVQKRFFEPLLAGRRRLARQSEPRQQASALDGRALRASYAALASAIARERGAASAADRRALEAQLGETLEPLDAALGELAASAVRLAASGDDEVVGAWRDWSARARSVFAAADRCWPRVAALLQDWRPGPRPSMWRRLFGGAGR